MRTRWLITLLLVAATGCQLKAPGATHGVKPAATTRLPLSEQIRKVADGQAVELSGAIRMLAGKGGAIISNNGGGIISDNGLGIISDNGLGVISNNGGSLKPYGVLDATAPSENLLADAQIEVLDAQGRLLAGPDGKPLVTTSDATGHYRFKASLPDETLVLRIRLYQGGQLFAFVAKGQHAGTLDIDTASSLGAAYVLDRYVKKRQAVADKLPASEAQALHASLDAARSGVKTATYRPQDLVAQTEQLRTQAAEVDTRLKAIEAILLAGQTNLGNGLPATQVSLATPTNLVGDGAGSLYVAESTAGRVRRINPDGTISPMAGGTGASGLTDGQLATEAALGVVHGVTFGPDKNLYVSLSTSARVVRISPDGKLHMVAGNGQRGPGPVNLPATQCKLNWPAALTFAPDGTLYIGEGPRDGNDAGRLLHLLADGTLEEIPAPPGKAGMSNVTGIVVEAGGAIWANVDEFDKGKLSRKAPGGDWKVLAEGLHTGMNSNLLPADDGGVILSESLGGRILHVDPTGQVTPLVGTGAGGEAETAISHECAGTWRSPDGTLYFIDASSAQVKALDAQGHVRTVAGASGVLATGDALSVSINQPAGLAIDAQGRLTIVEAASSTIKRLDGQTLTTLAGTHRGYSGDGGPAAQATFDGPFGIAYVGADLYVADTLNRRIRKIAPDGTVTTVAGDGTVGSLGSTTPQPALGPVMRYPMNLAVGPDELLYWTDSANNVVLRLKNGTVELVAGMPGEHNDGDAGDGGPATAAKLSHPVGLAFGPSGELFIADTGNMRVRKVDAHGVITTVAGLPLSELLGKLLSAPNDSGDGGDGTKAVLFGPGGLACDKNGNLYITELGTAATSTLSTGIGGGGLGAGIPLSALPKVPARIRKLAPDGTISTIAGPGSALLADPKAEGSLQAPVAIVLDAQGRLIVADANTNQVKLLPKGTY